MESGAFPKWSVLRNEGSSEAAEPTSNGSGRVCAFHHSGRAGAERSEPSRSEVSAGRSRNGAPVGAGAFEDASWNPWLLRYEPHSEDGHSQALAFGPYCSKE